MEEVRLVFLAANPSSKPKLDLPAELKKIRDGVAPAGDRISIHPYFAARPDNLRGALEIHRPHILHFCGFESDDGGLLLEDAKHEPAHFSPAALAALFKEYSHDVRLVFLNTCRVEKSAIALSEHVDAVVAFTDTNWDAYAAPFAGKFYATLAMGCSVQEAFDQAKAIYFENNVAANEHPRIWTRSGVSAATMRMFTGKSKAAAAKVVARAGAEGLPATSTGNGRAVDVSRQKEVFISYSHKDKKWLDEFHTFLQPVLRDGVFSVWDDSKIKPGSLWREDIEKALSAARVALLLVSAPFLASRFIQDEEMPRLLEAASKRGLQVLWVCLSACPYKETAIEPYQATHDPSRPLDSLPKPKRNAVLTEICGKVKTAFSERG